MVVGRFLLLTELQASFKDCHWKIEMCQEIKHKAHS